jgi:hypothetical protein
MGEQVPHCPCPECQQAPGGRTAHIHQALNQLLAGLDEKARRQTAGLLALERGRGGISQIAQITGLSRNTIQRGQLELVHPARAVGGRIRAPGGGRQPVEKKALS